MSEEARRPGILQSVGRRTFSTFAYAGGMAFLLGDSMRWLGRMLFVPGVRFGRSALAVQMVRVGVRSVSIVTLVQLLWA